VTPRQITIPAGQFEARTTFEPQSAADAQITAATSNLMTAGARVGVSIPLVLLICSAAGGVIDGYLSQRKTRKQNRWRGW
jgi:hypothetical protein